MELETERRRLADASKSHRKALRGEKREEGEVLFQESRNISWERKKDEKRERGCQTWWTSYSTRWFKFSIKYHIPHFCVVKQVGSYKKQIEEAEEISTINLCKKRLFPQCVATLCLKHRSLNINSIQANTVGWRVSYWVPKTGQGWERTLFRGESILINL